MWREEVRKLTRGKREGMVVYYRVGLIDDFGVGEEVRSDLVQRGKNDSFAQFGVDDGGVNGIDEYTLVQSFTEVGGIMNSSVPIITVHEHIEEHESFLSVAVVEEREPVMLFQSPVVFNLVYEFLHSLSTISVMGEVGSWVEVLGGILKVGKLSPNGLSHFQEEMKHILLLLGC